MTIKYEGLGDFLSYRAFKFPDSSLKIVSKVCPLLYEDILISCSLRSNEDILLIGLLSETLKRLSPTCTITCRINYMMYQQDDRQFSNTESYGLKFICNLLNTFPIDEFEVFHPHSDKVEFLRNCHIISNDNFISWVLEQLPEDTIWIVPDAGAAKTQLKQIEKLAPQRPFEIASKTRDHLSGQLSQYIGRSNFERKPCVIFDDICLKGGTFKGLKSILGKKNVGDIYLAVSHGVFNEGFAELLYEFKTIFTTDSICTQSDKYLKIYNL